MYYYVKCVIIRNIAVGQSVRWPFFNGTEEEEYHIYLLLYTSLYR